MRDRSLCEKTMVKDDKPYFINMVKGFAIFLMLYGHCIQYCAAESEIVFYENLAFNVIYSFHMPLFMLISGYLFYFSFSKYSFQQLLSRRIQSLIQPIICGSILIFLLTDGIMAVVSRDFGRLFDGGWLEKLSSIWFLWSVLAASIVVAIVYKSISNPVLRVLALIFGSVVVAFFPNAAENLFMYPYFVVGFYFAQHKNSYRCLWKMRYLSLALHPVLFYLYRTSGYHFAGAGASEMGSIAERCYQYGLKWIVGCMGALLVLTFFDGLHRILRNRSTGAKIGLFCANLGAKSLQIYVLSIPLLSAFLSVAFPIGLRILDTGNVFAQHVLTYTYVFTPILAVLYSFALYYVALKLEKWKISRILFGR